eukprot:2646493-Pyramimonas_sp.AAC.1
MALSPAVVISIVFGGSLSWLAGGCLCSSLSSWLGKVVASGMLVWDWCAYDAGECFGAYRRPVRLRWRYLGVVVWQPDVSVALPSESGFRRVGIDLFGRCPVAAGPP